MNYITTLLTTFFLSVSLIGNQELTGFLEISPHAKAYKDENLIKKPAVDHSFGFLELSAFPARFKDNKFGAAIGFRSSQGESTGTDFTFHVMKNPTEDVIICGKINQLFYLIEKQQEFSPYIGFGFVCGLGPMAGMVDERRCTYAEHARQLSEDRNEYQVFTNGEIVVGCETCLNGKRQFFELTYFARSTTIQFSLGIGL